MKPTKVKSFTLSEMLVVMVITVIVVGIAFSVLSLVQKQIRGIEKNFRKTTELSLLEQRLWQDFNEHNFAQYHNHKLVLKSETDTITYTFNPEYTLRDMDTIPLKTEITKMYYLGRETKSGPIDALSVSADKEVPDYSIFVSANHDASHFINNNGF
jgi:type II secretory pathway pseudopilin PulG